VSWYDKLQATGRLQTLLTDDFRDWHAAVDEVFRNFATQLSRHYLVMIIDQLNADGQLQFSSLTLESTQIVQTPTNAGKCQKMPNLAILVKAVKLMLNPKFGIQM